MIPELQQLHTPSASGFPGKPPEIPALPHSSTQKMERKAPSFLQSCVRAEFSVQGSVRKELLLRGFRTEPGGLRSLSQSLLQTSTGQHDLGLGLG